MFRKNSSTDQESINKMLSDNDKALVEKELKSAEQELIVSLNKVKQLLDQIASQRDFQLADTSALGKLIGAGLFGKSAIPIIQVSLRINVSKLELIESKNNYKVQTNEILPAVKTSIEQLRLTMKNFRNNNLHAKQVQSEKATIEGALDSIVLLCNEITNTNLATSQVYTPPALKTLVRQ